MPEKSQLRMTPAATRQLISPIASSKIRSASEFLDKLSNGSFPVTRSRGFLPFFTQ